MATASTPASRSVRHAAPHARLVERPDDRAVGVDALVDLEPQVTRNQRLRERLVEVEEVLPVRAPDLEHVAEAAWW